MTRSLDALVAYWDRQAPSYDRKIAGAERRYFADSRRWVCERADGATLELGIGTGASIRYYRAGVALTGVDWSREMLREAGKEAARLGRPVELHRADAAALPFPAAGFDTVTVLLALCCAPDPVAVLREAVRVLRPGGSLLLADHVAASFWPLRIAQHLVDLVSVPWHGEHYTRRPIRLLAGLEVEVVESERFAGGAIERVHARRVTAR